MYDTSELYKIFRTWSEQLRVCQFIGEIAVDESEMEKIAYSLINGDFRLRYRSAFETMLLVLAVNCTYYRYDDRGFWVHFQQLLDEEGVRKYGSTFESKLNELSFLRTRREGPFRYVGALLEQCGISRRHIPAFAYILSELNYKIGWTGLLSIKSATYTKLIRDMNVSKYLKDFLIDIEGRNFTLQVVKLLIMHHQGVITSDDLQEMHGFRKGFWGEILRQVQANRERVNICLFPPAFIFDPVQMKVGLRFPSSKYVMSNPPIAKIRYPVTFLENMDHLRNRYVGTVSEDRGEAHWFVTGWVPNNALALFDARSQRFLASHRKVKPGEYYLLAPEGYSIPDERRLKFLGQLQGVDSPRYDVSLVRINDGDRFYNNRSEEVERVDLFWLGSESKRVPYIEGPFDVFHGALPSLGVSNWRPIQDGTLGLFYQVGMEKGRIRDKEQLMCFSKLVETQAPVKGRLWIEELGRTRNNFSSEAMADLPFILVPEVKFLVPNTVQAFNEETYIHLEVTGGSIKVNGCEVVASHKHRWRVPLEADKVEARLSVIGIVFDLSIPVYRVRCFDYLQQPLQYLSSVDLRQDSSINIFGKPNTNFQLFVGEHSTRFFGRFDENGRYSIHYSSLGEKFNEQVDFFAPLHLSINNKIIQTGVCMIDVSRFKDYIITSSEPVSFVVEQHVEMLECYSLLKKICDFPLAVLDVVNIPNMHEELTSLLHEFVSCAQVLDHTEITENGQSVNFLERLENSDLRIALTVILRIDQGSEQDPQPITSSSIPKIPRWIDRANSIMNQVKGTQSLLEEWAEEVKAGRVYRLKSSLAMQKGGKELTAAWVQYRKGQHQVMLNNIANFERPASEFVKSLQRILQSVVYLREARFSKVHRLYESCVSDNEIDMVGQLLESAVSFIRMEKDFTPAVFSLVTQLPLKEQDKDMLGLLYRLQRGNYSTEDLKPTSDWLLLWIRAQHCKEEWDQISRAAADELLGNPDKIPHSPEKSSLLEQLSRKRESKV